MCDCCRCFPSLHPALLTFFIPSSLLVVFCFAILIYTCSTSRRRPLTSRQSQHRLEHADTKLRLLSGPSPGDVDHLRSAPLDDRTLTVLTLLLVLGALSWGSGAAAALLERRTLAGTVVACFYAVCTTTVALILFTSDPPNLTSPKTTRCTRKIFNRGGCLEQLVDWRKFSDRRTRAKSVRQTHSDAVKQVVYSINSALPTCKVCTTPTIQARKELDCISDVDRLEAALGMRDCTGSSCSLPVSLSALQLPVSVSECEQCQLCRSVTDSSPAGRCLSRNSTRMKDFDDDVSWSSDNENRESCPEGGWWNDDVDVDGCYIHRAPCPSPASACSSRASKNDLRVRRSEFSPSSSSRPLETAPASYKRPWSVIGASPVISRKTSRRRRRETGHVRGRQTINYNVSQSPSTDGDSPSLNTAYQKRRRVCVKPTENYSDA